MILARELKKPVEDMVLKDSKVDMMCINKFTWNHCEITVFLCPVKIEVFKLARTGPPFIGCVFVVFKNEKLNQHVAAINGNGLHHLVASSRIWPFVPKVLNFRSLNLSISD